MQLESREQVLKTKVLQGAGKLPIWNENFEMLVKYTGDDLQVKVYDEDTVSNDLIGFCSIKFTGLIQQTDHWYEIQYKGKPAGKVHLITKFTADEV